MDELEPINRRQIGPILWREKYVIAASIVVMLALAGAYAFTAAKVYQASAVIAVNVPNTAPGTDNTNANEALAQNYATLLTSAGFLNQIRSSVDGGRLSADSLQSRLSASAPQTGALVELNATAPSPEAAQTLAQQVIAGFLANLQNTAASRTRRLQQSLQQSITQLSDQIGTLRTQPASATTSEQISSFAASRQALINQNAALVANGLAQGTSATESAPPVASSTPVSPRKSLDLIAGLLLGVLLGVGLAWGRESLRPAIHSAEDVAALVNLPLLASIPLKTRPKPDDPALREAYGVLRTNLLFAVRSREARAVTFVGFNPGVGKTSAIEGVARAAAQGEHRVLIVDGDMRKATLTWRFNCRDHPGLGDVLQDKVSVDEALVEIDDGLWLLPTNPSRVNPATLLVGGRMNRLMDELTQRFDMVLFDSPPLSGLADGLILASQSDAVALVVRAGLTKPTDITSAISSLEQNRVPIAGRAYYGAVDNASRAPSATVAS
jgi:capsular exopolysaccharide synthesis family protein